MTCDNYILQLSIAIKSANPNLPDSNVKERAKSQAFEMRDYFHDNGDGDANQKIIELQGRVDKLQQMLFELCKNG